MCWESRSKKEKGARTPGSVTNPKTNLCILPAVLGFGRLVSIHVVSE